VAFAFAIAACVIAAIASLLTGPGQKAAAAPESLGAELAAVEGEGAFEPSELVVPDGAADRARDGDRTRTNGQSAAVSDSSRNKPG
jgi:hypothetical protein